MRTACGTRSGREKTIADVGSAKPWYHRLRFDSAPDHMEDKHNTLTPDDDYREAQGCGCVISIAMVIVIFAIAAGLWLFAR